MDKMDRFINESILMKSYVAPKLLNSSILIAPDISASNVYKTWQSYKKKVRKRNGLLYFLELLKKN